jgi:hypothetical protein
MSSEIDLYRANVPHGVAKYEYADWSSSQTTVTLTAGTSTEIYVNRLRFIAIDTMTITAGSIDLAGGEFTHSVSSHWELYGLADPFSLRYIQLDGTNDYVIGEIKFNPPIVVDSGETFTITANTLTKANALHFVVEYWEDTPAT